MNAAELLATLVPPWRAALPADADLDGFLRRHEPLLLRRLDAFHVQRRPRPEPHPADWHMVWLGCGAAKARGELPAIDLYTGSVYRAHRAIARHIAGPRGATHILSAQHGLLATHTVLRRYDATLADPSQRRAWSEAIYARLAMFHEHILDGRSCAFGFREDGRTLRGAFGPPRQPSILVLAGAAYIDGWAERARQLGIRVDDPLRGLGLGERRAFARTFVTATPARRAGDGLDPAPRQQLLDFVAHFRRRRSVRIPAEPTRIASLAHAHP